LLLSLDWNNLMLVNASAELNMDMAGINNNPVKT
jgi:hypothetical protein